MQRELPPAQKKDGQVSAGLFLYQCISGLMRNRKMYFHAGENNSAAGLYQASLVLGL